jgi:hypothetical protein
MSSDPLISNPAPPTPPDPEQIRKKRRLMRRNILLVSLALAIITALEVYFLQMRYPFATISNRITVLSLFNLREKVKLSGQNFGQKLLSLF